MLADRMIEAVLQGESPERVVEFVQHQTALDKFNKDNPDPKKSRAMKKAHRDNKSNYDKGQRKSSISPDRKRATRGVARHNERPRTPSVW